MDEQRRPVVMLASGSKDDRGHVYGKENVAGGKRRRGKPEGQRGGLNMHGGLQEA